MKLHYLLLLMVSPILSTAQNPHPIDNSIPAGNVDDYEKIGPYGLNELPGEAPPKERIMKEREWLWEHWRSRRRGLLIVTANSLEGDRSFFFYFVEPDKTGRWRIGIRIERAEIDRRGGPCKYYSVDTYSAYSVSRLALPSDTGGKRAVVAPEQTVPPDRYELVLESETGQTIKRF